MNKILYLFSSSDTSVAKVAINQIQALKKNFPRLDIKIACVNYSEENSLILNEKIYKKKHEKNKVLNYIKSLLFIKYVKNDFKPDVTISNLAAVNAYNVIIGKETKIGIFHAPMMQFKEKNIITQFANWVAIKCIYARLNGIIGISQEVVDDLRKNLGNNVDIQLEYNIHDLMQIDLKKEVYLREDLLTNKKTNKEIISLGVIDRNKRQDLLIKVLTKLDNTQLYIVGNVVDEIYYKELLSLIKEKKLTDRVIFIPFLDNPYPLLKRVDILISSSESEGLPGVVIEAIYINTPVICTNSSIGVWEILNCVEKYDKKLKSEIFADKGVIIPNPKSVSEEELIEILSNSISYIYKNEQEITKNNFTFSNKVSHYAVSSFYNFLEKKYNECNN